MKVENLMKRLELVAEDVAEYFEGDGTVNVEAFVAGVAALQAQLRPALPAARPVVRTSAATSPKPKPKAKKGKGKPRRVLPVPRVELGAVAEQEGSTVPTLGTFGGL